MQQKFNRGSIGATQQSINGDIVCEVIKLSRREPNFQTGIVTDPWLVFLSESTSKLQPAGTREWEINGLPYSQFFTRKGWIPLLSVRTAFASDCSGMMPFIWNHPILSVVWLKYLWQPIWAKWTRAYSLYGFFFLWPICVTQWQT